MTQQILVPLSQLDQSYLHEIGITLGHVVRSVDLAKLRAASIRVIDKWRLLAGHVEWAQHLSSWCVRVPLQGDVTNRLGFTTTKLKIRLDPCFVVNEHASAQVITRPPLNLFRAPSIPSDLQSYATSKTPIISIHITELLNCTCIGFSFPHGVLDAVGIGHFIHGLDAELNGRPWDAPAISSTNIVQEVLDTLEAAPPMYDDIHRETAAFSALKRSMEHASFLNKLAMLRHVAYEHIWHGVETRTVYLGEKVVAKLLRETRSEVERLGAGSVSMGDILAAWILKALTVGDTDDDLICINSIYSIRAMLQENYPAIKDYPLINDKEIDNGFTNYPLPPLSKQQLARMSVAEVAILHNNSLKPASEIAWVQAYNKYTKKTLRGRIIPSLRKGEEGWLYSNQVIGRIDRIDYGSKMFGVWIWFTPLQPHNQVGVNKFKGGFLIQSSNRPARWRAVAKAVEELNLPQPRL
ncbi:hypothetical protein H0H93_014405 [Arthromyces matolae]|nr:hypothetical protein H0H93_014405 [Arthromyces matolae]